LIEVKNLTKKYGANIAVNDLNFTIERGKIYGFLGPNGAGKSTTMNMLTGCLAPSGGTVLIDGVDIQDDAVRAKKLIGYLPETPPVYPDMTPEEYLCFVCGAKGVKSRAVAEEVRSVMDETGLTPMKDRLIKNLSKGYKQRVGIAQAMLGDPQIIILDEPTVGLDPKQITEIRALIKRLGKTKTVILSSHILAEVSEVCDRVMIINGGRLIASDTLENIRRTYSPENSFSLIAKGSEGAVSVLLNNHPDILSVKLRAENGLVYAEIETEAGTDLREALFYAFAKHELPLLEFKKVTPSLEEIFLSLTSSAYSDEEDEEYDEDDEYDDDEYDDDEYEDDDDEDYNEDEDEDEDENEDDEDDGGYKPLFS